VKAGLVRIEVAEKKKPAKGSFYSGWKILTMH